MLADSDLKRVLDVLKDLKKTLTIIYHPPVEATPFGVEMEEVLKQIQEASGGSLDIQTGDGAGLPARPAFSLSYEGRANIHYLSLPEGQEAVIFAETINALAKGAQDISEKWVDKVSQLKTPASVWVFMATTCPNCPQAVRAANQLAVVSGQVSAYIIDAQRFESLAADKKVMSVPTIVIDNEWTHVGVLPPEDLLERLLERDQQDYKARAFASLIETNRIEDAVAQILDGAGVEHFLENWRKSATSMRMGLLFAAENALEENPRSMDDIVPGLIPLLQNDDAALRGDTVDLLGRIGHPSARTAIEAALNDANPGVAEIAADVIEELDS